MAHNAKYTYVRTGYIFLGHAVAIVPKMQENTHVQVQVVRDSKLAISRDFWGICFLQFLPVPYKLYFIRFKGRTWDGRLGAKIPCSDSEPYQSQGAAVEMVRQTTLFGGFVKPEPFFKSQ